jgi:single-stranded-DNA-specific exonuclease
LARDFHRPALLLAAQDETATGSGRSIPGIELHEFLSRWGDRMERFGGHAQAVGMTVRLDRLEELRAEWEEAAAGWSSELLAPRHEYEIEAPPREVGLGLLAELQGLEPHGQGNHRPLLRTGPLTLAAPPRLFGNGHLAARSRGDDGHPVELVGFNWQARATSLSGRFEALGYLEKDLYTGGAVLRLVDSRPVPVGEIRAAGDHGNRMGCDADPT